MKPKQVYFLKPVGMKGPIKIGSSRLPEARLTNMVRWSPLPLEMIGSVPGSTADEVYLHRCFVRDHLHHEWFHWSDALLEAIARTLALGFVPRNIVDDSKLVRFSTRYSRKGLPPSLWGMVEPASEETAA